MKTFRMGWIAAALLLGAVVTSCSGSETQAFPASGGTDGGPDASAGGAAGSGGTNPTGGSAGGLNTAGTSGYGGNSGAAGAAVGGAAGAPVGGSAGSASGGTAGSATGGTGGASGGAGAGGVSGGGVGGSAGGAGPCSIQTGKAACDSCLDTSCPSQCAQCTANPECVALVQCGLLCAPNDQNCVSSCASQHQQGVNDAVPLAGPGGCASQNCATPCGQQAASCTLEVGIPACDACITSNCLSQCQTCSANTECVAIIACGLQCGPNNPSCVTQCASQHPQGLSAAQSLAGPNTGCLATHCAAQCPL
jgi:hypothetical protein